MTRDGRQCEKNKERNRYGEGETQKEKKRRTRSSEIRKTDPGDCAV